MRNPLLGKALCLAAAIAAATSVAADAAQRTCRFTQRDFIANWGERVAPDESAEDTKELQFDLDNGHRISRSWLHQRPEMTGTWSFSNCRITARGPDNMTMTYRFLGSDRNRLVDVESGVTYRRLR